MRYADLDVTTNFSFLRGASHAAELVNEAKSLGQSAIGVTDLNTLAGAVRMHQAAKDAKIHLCVGARLQFVDSPDVLVWAENRQGYANLCRLLTTGKRRAEKGQCTLYLEDLLKSSTGLWAAVVGQAIDPEFGEADLATLRMIVGPLKDVFGDRLSLAVSRLYEPADDRAVAGIAAMGRARRIPLLATNQVHYHDEKRRMLQDVLACIRHGCSIRDAGFRLFPNGQRFIKSAPEMQHLFYDLPGAIGRTIEVANACKFSLDELRYEYPDEIVPSGKTSASYLADLTWTGAAARYPQGIPEKVRCMIERELTLIERFKIEPYFLTVYDLVHFARSREILCQGRGSAANSAVCYCLGVTSVDPDKIELLFERFFSSARSARAEPPDIDVDFEHERREEVIQYLYEKYGRDRAGMTAEAICYRGRSAVRDVGKALGLGLDAVNEIAKRLNWWHFGSLTPRQLAEAGIDPNDPMTRQLIDLTHQLIGFTRHLGQHVGGMVMTRGPLCELVPIENASMEDRTVIEWDKDDIDALGILKVDVLALGMLTCISKAMKMVNNRHEGTEARRHEGGDGEATIASSSTSCLEFQRPDSHLGSEELRVNNRHAGNEEIFHGADSHISRPYCLAVGNEAGSDDLSGDPADAQIGTIRIGQSDAKGGRIHSVEHCRRLCPAEYGGLSQISPDCSRIAGGVINPIRTCSRTEDVNADTGDAASSRGGGSGITGPDPQLGIKDRHEKDRHEGTEARRHEVEKEGIAASLSSPPCLRASVPSCLRASVPSCLQLHSLSAEDPAVYERNEVEKEGIAASLSSPPCLRASVPSCLQLHSLPPEDPAVYEMICDADTIGVFQIESRAQMSMLPRLKPREFYDLVIEVAIVRPGPIQGDMVHPYLRRRNGEEKVEYPSEALKEVLGRTLGVPLFQEQAMKLAMVAAGFSAEEADQLRRAMAAWRYTGQIEQFQRKIIDGMCANGYTPEFAERCFNQIRGFGEYGFPESHAASFALLVYASCWIKRHHPGIFCCAILNSQPMGFYQPAQLVRDARQHGVEVRPIDVNFSQWDCTLEDPTSSGLPGKEKSTWGRGGPSVRLGFRMIKGMRQAHANTIAESRNQSGIFNSIEQFQLTTGLPRSAIERLAEADAFGSLPRNRRIALWQTMALSDEQHPLFAKPIVQQDESVAIPAMSLKQEVMTDYSYVGLSLKRHPVSFVRSELARRKIITAAELNHRESGWVSIAGLVLIRQRPGTASGIVFVTLEDETGVANLIIRPDIFERFSSAACRAYLLKADGRVQREGQVIHVLAQRLEDLGDLLSNQEFHSRDFH